MTTVVSEYQKANRLSFIAGLLVLFFLGSEMAFADFRWILGGFGGILGRTFG